MYLYKCQFGDNKYNNNKGGRKILDLCVCDECENNATLYRNSCA